MSDRYAVERVKERMWAVTERGRQGAPIGGSPSETGARDIASLLTRMRAATRRSDARLAAESRTG